MNITVVGLGKIGLPLAVQFARMGNRTFGADINALTVDAINSGEEPFPGEKHLAEYLKDCVASGLLTATTDTTKAVAQSDVVVVAVPLFVDHEATPDFGAIDAAAEAVGRGLRRDTLVSFETTLPVGTTRTRLTPILTHVSKLVASSDFHVVFSPERVLTGRIFEDLRRYPKLVGGLCPAGEQVGCNFYASVLEFDQRDDLPHPNGVWSMGSAEAAEMAKLAETTYRDVNIGLANQFARWAEKSGVDVYRVIEACNSQPYSHIHQPGIAVGGHCIPVYPRLYLWNDPDATIVRAARSVNASMPEHVVARLETVTGTLRDMRIAVLGAAYRGGVKETAFSGVWDVVNALEQRGAVPLVHDPLFSDSELIAKGFTPFHRGDYADAVIVQADHAEYAEWGSQDAPHARVVMDGRGIIQDRRWSGTGVFMIGR
jgi:nucleotide sugar dehydrogenase